MWGGYFPQNRLKGILSDEEEDQRRVNCESASRIDPHLHLVYDGEGKAIETSSAQRCGWAVSSAAQRPAAADPTQLRGLPTCPMCKAVAITLDVEATPPTNAVVG